jgi:hypothetical protein
MADEEARACRTEFIVGRSLDGQRQRIEADVQHLASHIGPRNIYHFGALEAAARFIEHSLVEAGHSTVLQPYRARNRAFVNIVAEVSGGARQDEIVIVGAHYDTHKNSPGANDNGSAVAALLELARSFAPVNAARTLRLVAFTNEEKPFTRQQDMASRVYARHCRAKGENIVAMVCLETIGCFSQQVGSQWLSFRGLLLPRQGNFLALIANRFSKPLLTQVHRTLKEHESVPYRPIVLPTHFPGAWSSDHWCFWKEGYPALMVTDTGRCPGGC